MKTEFVPRHEALERPGKRPGKRPLQKSLSIPLLWVCLLVAAGCAGHGPVTGGGGIRVITRAEMDASDADHVLELIQRLRPAWLAGSVLGDPSDPANSGGPSVLINDIPPKPLYSLQFLTLQNIKEVRYLTRTTAETRFRVGARHGLILVLTQGEVMPQDTLPPDTGAAGKKLRLRKAWVLGGPGIDGRLVVYPGQPHEQEDHE